MRLCRPAWFRLLAVALVFGLTCGAAPAALWAAPQSVTSSAPAEEEDETSKSETKPAAAERRAVPPVHEKAGAAPRPRHESPLPPTTAPAPARPATALNNGLAAHYRC
jgi:hypothetical protein